MRKIQSILEDARADLTEEQQAKFIELLEVEVAKKIKKVVGQIPFDSDVKLFLIVVEQRGIYDVDTEEITGAEMQLLRDISDIVEAFNVRAELSAAMNGLTDRERLKFVAYLRAELSDAIERVYHAVFSY